MPPFRWVRRGPAAKRRIARYVDRFLAAAFGDHNLDQVRADAEVVATDLGTSTVSSGSPCSSASAVCGTRACALAARFTHSHQ